jgi:rare lipoprotein A
MKNLILTLTLALIPVQPSLSETGKASYYSVMCNGGTHTASGERLVDTSNTAAHRTLPFGTLVKVTNLKNGKSEVVKVTNRGPYIRGRIIDVTIGVAKKLGFINSGVVPVKIEVVGKVKLKS